MAFLSDEQQCLPFSSSALPVAAVADQLSLEALFGRLVSVGEAASQNPIKSILATLVCGSQCWLVVENLGALTVCSYLT